jgi:hypothetical protein
MQMNAQMAKIPTNLVTLFADIKQTSARGVGSLRSVGTVGSFHYGRNAVEAELSWPMRYFGSFFVKAGCCRLPSHTTEPTVEN